MKARSRLLATSMAVVLIAGGLGTPAGAAPVLCQKKSGVVVARDPSCKKKETPLDLARFGVVASGLFAHTQNAEFMWPILDSATMVAVIGDPADYSGSYSSPLVHPTGTGYVAVSVQAHVRNVSGAGVTCALENRAGAGTWTQLAQTAVPASDGFLGATFPSFVGGTTWSFRVVCQTSSGTGTAQGEIFAIGGVLA